MPNLRECSATGGRRFRYVVRLHVFRGQPFVNDDQDALMAQFDSIEIVCSTKSSGDDRLILNGSSVEASRLEQIDDRQFAVNGQSSPGHAPGWAAVASPTGGIAVGVQEFWQNWPKSLETKPGELRLGLCDDYLLTGAPGTCSFSSPTAWPANVPPVTPTTCGRSAGPSP